MSLGKLGIVLLILSPLVYSGPGYIRLYAALAIATASCVLFVLHGMRLRAPEIVFVAMYATTLILQSLVIPDVWFTLAAGHGLFMVAMFVPSWAIFSSRHHLKRFEDAAVWALNLLSAITIVSIYVSFFFGVGTIVDAGAGVQRAFAWLGDRYTPVIVLLIIFFTLQERWLHVLALVGALLMTGGKSGVLLLFLTPLTYAFVTPMPLRRKMVVIVLLILFVVSIYAGRDLVLTKLFPGADWALSSRMLANQVGILYFLDSPWLGVGIDRSIYESVFIAESIIDFARLDAYTMPRIHNAFVRTAAELGIPGLAALLGLCGLWIWRCSRILVRAYLWRPSAARNLCIAGALWSMSFVMFYQTVDWFMGGENQLAWLLMILAITETVFRRQIHLAAHRTSKSSYTVYGSSSPHGVGRAA